MEAVIGGVEDVLIGGLSYKIAPGASYVVDRKSSTFHPSGSNYYSTTGTKLIKLLISGDHWMDPSTFRVMFDLVNDDSTAAKELRPLGSPWSFFSRMRILCGGQLVEDIDSYNRVHEMFSVLTASDSKLNVEGEAFGKRGFDAFDTLNPAFIPGIPGGGGKQTVMFKPLSGLLNQPKYLPLRYCPITIELEVVSTATDPIVSVAAGGFDLALKMYKQNVIYASWIIN
jgi:hypothetical protein